MLDIGFAGIFSVPIASFLHAFQVSGARVLSWSVKLALLHKPLNLIISTILTPYRPKEKDEEMNDKNIGRLIGTLERIIMTIFLSIGQYSAVGLVLTAKSIARYDRISKQQDFAEYYLLGTLLSTIGAVCVSLLL